MPLEIERKFLVRDISFLNGLIPFDIKQGYIHIGEKSVSRVRIVDNKKATITIKGKTGSISRLEYEYEIPLNEAIEILENICLKPIIEKKRYKLFLGKHLWEIDVFYGENDGLVVAEIELESEEEKFEKPEWVLKDVSEDERYYNYYLVNNPYKEWKNKY